MNSVDPDGKIWIFTDYNVPLVFDYGDLKV